MEWVWNDVVKETLCVGCVHESFPLLWHPSMSCGAVSNTEMSHGRCVNRYGLIYSGSIHG